MHHPRVSCAKRNVLAPTAIAPEVELYHALVHYRSGDAFSAIAVGQSSFDREHSDVLYVYQDARDQPLEGHLFRQRRPRFHYQLRSQLPTRPQRSLSPMLRPPDPSFQLVYRLKDSVMSGKFQMRMPGQAQWRSYLEWNGGKK